MPLPQSQPEVYLDCPALQARMRQAGIVRHYDYWRALIRECPCSIRGEYIRFSDAWTWWSLNPAWRPFSRREEKVGETLALSAQFGAARVEKGA